MATAPPSHLHTAVRGNANKTLLGIIRYRKFHITSFLLLIRIHSKVHVTNYINIHVNNYRKLELIAKCIGLMQD